MFNILRISQCTILVLPTLPSILSWVQATEQCLFVEHAIAVPHGLCSNPSEDSRKGEKARNMTLFLFWITITEQNPKNQYEARSTTTSSYRGHHIKPCLKLLGTLVGTSISQSASSSRPSNSSTNATDKSSRPLPTRWPGKNPSWQQGGNNQKKHKESWPRGRHRHLRIQQKQRCKLKKSDSWALSGKFQAEQNNPIPKKAETFEAIFWWISIWSCELTWVDCFFHHQLPPALEHLHWPFRRGPKWRPKMCTVLA